MLEVEVWSGAKEKGPGRGLYSLSFIIYTFPEKTKETV
jgi:hypothetical protein